MRACPGVAGPRFWIIAGRGGSCTAACLNGKAGGKSGWCDAGNEAEMRALNNDPSRLSSVLASAENIGSSIGSYTVSGCSATSNGGAPFNPSVRADGSTCWYTTNVAPSCDEFSDIPTDGITAPDLRLCSCTQCESCPFWLCLEPSQWCGCMHGACKVLPAECTQRCNDRRTQLQFLHSGSRCVHFVHFGCDP